MKILLECNSYCYSAIKYNSIVGSNICAQYFDINLTLQKNIGVNVKQNSRVDININMNLILLSSEPLNSHMC